MAALFTAASSQQLDNVITPIGAFPFTVGLWFYPINTTQQTLFCVTDTGTTNNFFSLSKSTTFQIGAAAGATTSTTTIATMTAGAWQFLIGRFISATNRRLTALRATGQPFSAQGTATRAPAGLDQATLGALVTSAGSSAFFDGAIGEFWYTNTDIQDDGGVLANDTFLQLAYGGPFSVPHIAKDILEYRSFRKHPSSEGDELGEVFHGALGRQTWTNTNGVSIGSHPPFPYWYVKPDQYVRNMTV